MTTLDNSSSSSEVTAAADILRTADRLADASIRARASIAATDAELGVLRRAAKLERQLNAASRLLARGTRLGAPQALRAADALPDRAVRVAGTGDLSQVDATIRYATMLIVRLHAWRGHGASVPLAER